jgi:hypothetical protein
MPNKSRANKRRPATHKTYKRKLDRIKKWYNKRVEARKSWPEERLKKVKPLKPLEFYTGKLRTPGGDTSKKTSSTSSLTSRKTKAWYQ